MKKFAALAFAGMTALAAPAFAGSEFEIGAQRLNVDLGGFGSVEYSGVALSYDNSYANGFEMNSSAFLGEANGEEVVTSTIEAAWKWRNLVGPKFVYSVVSTTFDRESSKLAGVTAQRDFGPVTVSADLLSDIDAFGDNPLLIAEADFRATDALTLTAGYSASFGDVDANEGFIGAKYGFGNGIFVSARAGRGELADGVTTKAAFVGVGISF